MKNIHCKATEYRRDQRKKDEKNKERRKRRIGFNQNKAQQEVDSENRLKINPKSLYNQLTKERLVFLIFNQLQYLVLIYSLFVQKVLLYNFVFSRAPSLTEKVKICKRALKRCESCPQLASFDLHEENHIASETSSRSYTPNHRDHHSHLKDERYIVKHLSSILQNYGNRHEDGTCIKYLENAYDIHNPKMKTPNYSFHKSAPRNTPKHSISLQEVVARARVSNYNGLGFSDPVHQITKSFKTSVPDANNDFFDKTKTGNCDTSVNG